MGVSPKGVAEQKVQNYTEKITDTFHAIWGLWWSYSAIFVSNGEMTSE